MKDHVGKKRRKEVRQAATIQHEMRTYLVKGIACLVVLFACYGLYFLLAYLRLISLTSTASSIVMGIILLVFAFIGASQFRQIFDRRREFKKHCRKYNINNSDIREYKAEHE